MQIVLRGGDGDYYEPRVPLFRAGEALIARPGRMKLPRFSARFSRAGRRRARARGPSAMHIVCVCTLQPAGSLRLRLARNLPLALAMRFSLFLSLCLPTRRENTARFFAARNVAKRRNRRRALLDRSIMRGERATEYFVSLLSHTHSLLPPSLSHTLLLW